MRRRSYVLLNRALNRVVRTLRLRRFRGGDLLMLTTVGRRSGTPRTTPLLYIGDHGDWVVVASNGGADWQPGWWLNLRAGAPGTVALEGAETAVTAAEVSGPERERLWRALNASFDYEGYQRRVSRRLAVVRLSPVRA